MGKDEYKAHIYALTGDRDKSEQFAKLVHRTNYDGFKRAIAGGHDFDNVMKWFGDGHERDQNDVIFDMGLQFWMQEQSRHKETLTTK